MNGAKRFITFGAMVDMAIALVTTDRTLGTKAMMSIIVEKEMPGFLREKKRTSWGFEASRPES